MKQFYKTSDPKGVHINESGKDIIIKINTIINALMPECAGVTKRKWSSNHSPTAGQQKKEQGISSTPPQNVTSPVLSTVIRTYARQIA